MSTCAPACSSILASSRAILRTTHQTRQPGRRMHEPLVSVITPTYQRCSALSHCLDSVAAQTYKNIEHIVIDGGSTDGTIQLLKRRTHDYRLTWTSEPDQGMYEAINKGLNRSSGEVLCYLNSDDLLFPWSLAVVVAALKEADLVYGDLLLLRTDRTSGSAFLLQGPVYH